MSDQFLGEIRIFGWNAAPYQWAACNGQLLPISQNAALFSLLGTTYGGNGTTTFALPNLQGVAPIAAGQGPNLSMRDLGDGGGETSVTLTLNQLPSHTHAAQAGSFGKSGPTATPANNTVLSSGLAGALIYVQNPTAFAAMNSASVVAVGNNTPHQNLQPFLALNFCIALNGIFPSRP